MVEEPMSTLEQDLWINDPQVLFDLETGGVSPDDDEIVTGTIILVPARPLGGGPRVPQVYEYLIAPERDIPQAATDVHGITTEYARKHGKPPAETIERMLSMLTVLMGSGATLIGMNISFDLTFMDRAAARYGLVPLDNRLLPQGISPVVDVYVIDKEMSRRKGGRRLTDLCGFYGVRMDGAHDATADALAAGRVAWAQCRDYLKIRNAKAEDLHQWQIEWRAKQQKSFASWLRGEAAKKTHADPAESNRMLASAAAIRTEWPVIPLAVPEPDPEPEASLW